MAEEPPFGNTRRETRTGGSLTSNRAEKEKCGSGLVEEERDSAIHRKRDIHSNEVGRQRGKGRITRVEEETEVIERLQLLAINDRPCLHNRLLLPLSGKVDGATRLAQREVTSQW